jgi:asparagine synthase (glutamine-hydrolysing)
MCGINGFSWSDRRLIEEMNRCLKHRGPDDDGTFVNPDVSLGSVRLAILDLSESGKMPMSNQSKTIWVAYNGEIYNFKKLRTDLERAGRRFVSNTDTEVLIQCYERDGIDCVKYLNGIFAFSLYDSVDGCLYLARDRLGIKPLFYYYDGDKLVFSSELKAFRAVAELPLSLDTESILEYRLTKNVEAEGFFKELKPLQPASVLKLELNTKHIDIKTYYDPCSALSRTAWTANKFDTELVDKLDRLLNEVIQDQLVSDAPIGSICSGGVDSSLVTAIARQYVDDLTVFNVRVKGSLDESKYAKRIARELGLNLIIEELDEIKFKDNITRCIGLEDLPLCHPNSVGIYLISKRAKEEGFSVLLSGEGADELFGGYPRYRYYYVRMWLKKVLSPLINGLPDRYEQLLKSSVYELIGSDDFVSCLLEDGAQIIFDYHALPWVKNRSASKYRFSQALDFLDNSIERETLTYILKDLSYYLSSLLRRSDRMAMGVGLEMRVPFLDNRLLDLAVNLPLKYKVTAFDTKPLLKRVAKRYLPSSIVNRSKAGFDLPTLEWLGEDFRHFCYAEWQKTVMQAMNVRASAE